MNPSISLEGYYARPSSVGKHREYPDFSYLKLERIGKGARKTCWAAQFPEGTKAVLKEFFNPSEVHEMAHYIKVITTLKGHPAIAVTEKTFWTKARNGNYKFFQIQTLYTFDLIKALNTALFAMSPALIEVAFRQLSDGLKFIHEKGVVVNDLKVDNIYVKYTLKEVQFVYGDFGGADLESSRSALKVTTRTYASPQALRGSKVKEDDIFSLGICFAAIQKKIRGFQFPIEIAKEKKIPYEKAIALFSNRYVRAPYEKLIPGMLAIDCKKRPSAQTVAKKVRELKTHRRAGSL